MKRCIITLVLLLLFITQSYAAPPDINGQWNFSGTYVTDSTSKYRSFQGTFNGTMLVEASAPVGDYIEWECTIYSIAMNGYYLVGNSTVPFSGVARGPLTARNGLVHFTAGGDAYSIDFNSERAAFIRVSGILQDDSGHSVTYMGSAPAYHH